MSSVKSTVNMLLADSFSGTKMKTFKFSHIWTIENFNFCLNEDFITSPPFGARNDPGTRRSLRLHPEGDSSGYRIHLNQSAFDIFSIVQGWNQI